MNATKERQAWCCLQVKLCDPCLSALCVPWCKKALYKYSSFPFVSFPFGHPLRSTENFTEIVPGEPLYRGELNTRGVAKYSDFGPIDGCIAETVQDRR